MIKYSLNIFKNAKWKENSYFKNANIMKRKNNFLLLKKIGTISSFIIFPTILVACNTDNQQQSNNDKKIDEKSQNEPKKEEIKKEDNQQQNPTPQEGVDKKPEPAKQIEEKPEPQQDSTPVNDSKKPEPAKPIQKEPEKKKENNPQPVVKNQNQPNVEKAPEQKQNPEDVKREELRQKIENVLIKNKRKILVIDEFKNVDSDHFYEKEFQSKRWEWEFLDLKKVSNFNIFEEAMNTLEYEIGINKKWKVDSLPESGEVKFQLYIKEIKNPKNILTFDDVYLYGFEIKEKIQTKMQKFLTQKILNHEVLDLHPSLIGMMLLFNDNNIGYRDSDNEPEAYFSYLSSSYSHNHFLSTSGKYENTRLNYPLKFKFLEMNPNNEKEFDFKISRVKFNDYKGTLDLDVEIFEREKEYSSHTITMKYSFDGFKKIKENNTGPIDIALNKHLSRIDLEEALKLEKNKTILESFKKSIQELENKNEVTLKMNFKSFMRTFIKKNLYYFIKDIENSAYNSGGRYDNLEKTLLKSMGGLKVGIYPVLTYFSDTEMVEIKNINLKLVKKEDNKIYLVVNYPIKYNLANFNSYYDFNNFSNSSGDEIIQNQTTEIEINPEKF